MTNIATNATTASATPMATVKPSTAAAVDPNSAAAQQNKFLTLLVTQMKNQDPLNPMDNAQVTSQLAQLSTVDGIDKLNTTLTALQGNYQTSQSLQASALIGRGVLVPGSALTLSGSKAVLGVDLTASADDVKVTIKDGSGKAIRTMDLGSQDAGTLPLQWDGQTDTGTVAVDGQYSFVATATRSGIASTATALSYGQVASVSTNTQGVRLNVPNVGAVDVSAVKQFL